MTQHGRTFQGSDHEENLAAGSPGAASGTASAAPALRVKEVGVEPTVRRRSFPALPLALLSLLVYWGTMHLVQFGGGADPRVHSPYLSFEELDELQPKDEFQIMMLKGRQLYTRHCSTCHQNDGNGSTSQNIPPLAGSEWVLVQDPSRLIHIVLHGLRGPIEVKGKLWGAAQMSSLGGLEDEEIALALSYVRNSWGNKAPPVKPDQVNTIREQTKDRRSQMTVPELMEVPLQE